MLRRLLLLADVIALSSSYWVTTSLATVVGDGVSAFPSSGVILAAGLPIWLALTYTLGLYHVDSRRAEHGVAEEIGPTLQVATLWSWSLMLIMWLADVQVLPVGELVTVWALSVVVTTLFRAGVRAWSRRRSWYVQNTLVLGTSREIEGVVRRILRHPEYGLNVVACMEYFDSTSLRYIDHIPVVGTEADVLRLVEAYDIDRVIIAWSAQYRSDTHQEAGDRFELVRQLSNRDVYVDLLPTWSQVLGSRLEVAEMEGLPLLGVPRTRLSRSALILKRAFDIAVSAGALLFLLPLILAFSLAIKLASPGPVLFRQRRIGKNGQPFDVFKFRSMYQDAEATKGDFDGLNLHAANDGVMFKVREDPRVTPVGRLLRKTSLDELPQLINILRGDMSLVGPRPLIEHEDRQVEGRFRRRLDLTPGLTGLWQVHGRSEIPFEQMVNLDYLYVSSWSLFNDFKILLKTFPAVIGRRGAY
jgi:exopolysaccharide biosynthesis polyprenyl glycosylphosphotransferase